VPDRLELRVHARDLLVPRQRELVVRASPDRQPPAHAVELEDHLRALVVAVDEERRAAALGLEHRLQLGRGGLVRAGGHCAM
jgi:hypothetical protein